MRLKQGDMLAIASGTLKLTASGHLDGDLLVTATGVEKVLPALGVDMLAQAGGSRNETHRRRAQFPRQIGAGRDGRRDVAASANRSSWKDAAPPRCRCAFK